MVGVGDAENDHTFLRVCECRVVVGNAQPALKERADLVTKQTHGAGVEELIQHRLENDLGDLAPQLKRHEVVLGDLENGEPFSLPVYGLRLLIAGPLGRGKSTTVSTVVDRLTAAKYQVCLFDPEGDYDEFEPPLSLGGPDRIPASTEVCAALSNPSQSVSINLLGVPLTDRLTFFQSLLVHVQELRVKTGRPHWIVIDEAHHLLRAEFVAGVTIAPKELTSIALVTVHPDLFAPEILKMVDGIFVVGKDPETIVELFNEAAETDHYLDVFLAPPTESSCVLAWPFVDLAAISRLQCLGYGTPSGRRYPVAGSAS